MANKRVNIDNLEEVISIINNRDERAIDWTVIEQKTGYSKRSIQRRTSEAGYRWCKSTLKYIKDFDSTFQEVAVTIEKDENSNDESKGELIVESNKYNEIEAKAIAEITNKANKKEEYKAMTVYFREDIFEALNKFAKDSPNKKAKQQVINDMMELFLKQNKYL